MNSYFNHTVNRISEGTTARGAQVNNIADEIEQAFDLLPAPSALSGNLLDYGVDTGVADAYVVTKNVTVTSYTAGMSVTFVAANTNTGASTVDVDGVGVTAIQRPGGTALAAGDIAAGAVVTLRYDGSVFQMVSWGSNWPDDPANVSITGGAINGTTVGATTAASGRFTTLASTGAATLASGTVTGAWTVTGAFTSRGINDDATAERLKINDSSFVLAAAGVPANLIHAANDQVTWISGGNATNTGANLLLYGGAHATAAGDVLLRTSTTNILHYDHSATLMTISTALTVTGAFTSLGIDDNATGERLQIGDSGMLFGAAGASYTMNHVADDWSILFSGGNAFNSGGNFILYGGTHATQAGDFRLRTSGTDVINYDHSAVTLDLAADVRTFSNSAGTEQARFDSGGTLLIGKTTAEGASTGLEIQLSDASITGGQVFSVTSLLLENSAGNYLQMVAGATSVNAIYLGKPTDGDLNGWIANNTSGSEYVAHRVGGGERMRLTKDGNLLIGTTSDSGSELQIDGATPYIELEATTDGDCGLIFSSNRTTGSSTIGQIQAEWNNNTVAQIRFLSGVDTGNKDDGSIAFYTSASGPSVQQQAYFATDGTLIFNNGLGIRLDNLASANPNTLDDYEEGTWTPVLSDGTNNATMDVGTVGRYTKIGNRVFVYCRIDTSSLGSVSGSLRVTGLPFTAASGGGRYPLSPGQAQGLNLTAGTCLSGSIDAASTYFNIFVWDAVAGATLLQDTEWSADGDCTFSGHYDV